MLCAPSADHSRRGLQVSATHLATVQWHAMWREPFTYKVSTSSQLMFDSPDSLVPSLSSPLRKVLCTGADLLALPASRARYRHPEEQTVQQRVVLQAGLLADKPEAERQLCWQEVDRVRLHNRGYSLQHDLKHVADLPLKMVNSRTKHGLDYGPVSSPAEMSLRLAVTSVRVHTLQPVGSVAHIAGCDTCT